MEKEFEYNGLRFFAQWRDGTVPGTVIYCHEGEEREELRRLWAEICVVEPGGNDSCGVDKGCGENDSGSAANRLQSPDLMLVSITGTDWNCFLSPWPASRAFKGGDDFAGKADEYIKMLEEAIPRLEDELKAFTGQAAATSGQNAPAAETPEDAAGLDAWPKRRGIAGYSLGGLFAVYCFYRTDLFSLLGSMSGSLWFDKFGKYMAEHQMNAVPKKAYFSLGDKEPQVKNQRMAAVGECTKTAEKLFRDKGAITIFEWNKGGHFNDVQKRVAKGIRWLAHEMQFPLPSRPNPESGGEMK